MKELILIGGGGHCKSCINVIESIDSYHIKGILDLPEKIGTEVLGYPVIGTDADAERFITDDIVFCLAIGQVNAGESRRSEVFSVLIGKGAVFPVISYNGNNISRHSMIESGTMLFRGVFINASANIGRNCIINSNALIEHDSTVGDHCHVSTNAVINGGCVVGNNCFIGSRSVLKNGISICDDTMIGMGAVVTKSINCPGLYFGNPARRIGR